MLRKLARGKTKYIVLPIVALSLATGALAIDLRERNRSGRHVPGMIPGVQVRCREAEDQRCHQYG